MVCAPNAFMIITWGKINNVSSESIQSCIVLFMMDRNVWSARGATIHRLIVYNVKLFHIYVQSSIRIVGSVRDVFIVFHHRMVFVLISFVVLAILPHV